MKGYLQRLAASIVGPRSRVYPFVGSIFPGERLEVAPAPLPLSEAFVPTDDPVSTRLEVAERSTEPTPHRQSAEQVRVERSLVTTGNAEHELFEPLLARKAPNMETPAALPRKASQTEITAALPETALSQSADLQSPPGSPHTNQPSENLVDAVPVERLIVDDSVVPRRQREIVQASPLRPPKSSAVSAAFRADSPRAAALQIFSEPSRAEGGPDDIQIHIGRVEVIAVPPAAPRPAAAPARKAMSLDEYLRRRDRGPG
jgi:hypothetical protein